MHGLSRALGAVVALALVAGACSGGPGTAAGPPETTLPPEASFVFGDDEVVDTTFLAEGADFVGYEQIAEVRVTGPVDGAYEAPIRCMIRDEPGGPHLHVFVSPPETAKPGEPTLRVVLRIRPPDHTGPLELGPGDVEVDYHPTGGVASEPMEARITVDVDQRVDEYGTRSAEIAFSGEYRGAPGEGAVEGTVRCAYF